MADVFTAGVKRGGLNNATEIRILLCYLIKTAGPVTRELMQNALLEEELVNYFEFVDALNELEAMGLATSDENGYTITEKGAIVANTLSDDLPLSVRESATRAMVRIQSWLHKAAQNQATISKTTDGYSITCAIQDMGCDIFSLTLAMPDAATAELVKNQFIAHGSEIYSILLTQLTQPNDTAAIPPESVR